MLLPPRSHQAKKNRLPPPRFHFASVSVRLYNKAVNTERRGPERRRRNLGPEVGRVERRREMCRCDTPAHVGKNRFTRYSYSRAAYSVLLFTCAPCPQRYTGSAPLDFPPLMKRTESAHLREVLYGVFRANEERGVQAVRGTMRMQEIHTSARCKSLPNKSKPAWCAVSSYHFSGGGWVEQPWELPSLMCDLP